MVLLWIKYKFFSPLTHHRFLHKELRGIREEALLRYELTVISDDFQAATIKHEVKISVKCKYNVFP